MKISFLKNFLKYILALVLTLTIPAFASKPMPEEFVETICQTAKNQSLSILFDLEIKFITYPNKKRLESYREVLTEGLNLERKRLESKMTKDESYSNLLSLYLIMAEQNYKFALCEKFNRQDARPITIAEESYMACRIENTTNQRIFTRKGKCF
jgi:hypothetical protein